MNLYGDIKKYYFSNEEGKERKYHEIVSNYIQFYHGRAKRSQYIFYGMSVVKIIAIASIPILETVGEYQVKWAIIASALSLIMEGLIALLRAQDKWHLYRSTNNALLQEQREYMMRVGKYAQVEGNVLELYVENIEQIIGDEARKWFSTVKNNKQGEENAEK